MKTGKKIVMAFALMVVAALVFLAWSSIYSGYSASVQPPRWEAYIARRARKLLTPWSARQMKIPVAATPERLAEGREHWMEHCATCHAPDGSGDTDIGRNLYPPAPDMRLAATQNLSDGELYYIITNGVRFTGMPAWGGEHTPEETWHLVFFIRHLPQLTREELREMQQVSPQKQEEHEMHHEHHH